MELEYSTGIPCEILEMTQELNQKDEGKSKTVQKSANKTVLPFNSFQCMSYHQANGLPLAPMLF